MKFNPKPNLTSEKEIAKQEQKLREQQIAINNHADYELQREKIDAPFGKAFKTGAHKSEKVYKREKPVKGRDY